MQQLVENSRRFTEIRNYLIGMHPDAPRKAPQPNGYGQVWKGLTRRGRLHLLANACSGNRQANEEKRLEYQWVRRAGPFFLGGTSGLWSGMKPSRFGIFTVGRVLASITASSGTISFLNNSQAITE